MVVPGSLGIEVLHLHPWKLDPEVAGRAARVAARHLHGLLESRDRLRQPTACVVMLDDYFLSGRPARIERVLEEARDTIVAAAEGAGLGIDLIVRESAMVHVAEQLVDLLGERVAAGPDGATLSALAPYRRFGIDDVPVWTVKDGARQWTCPFLAAAWQLCRLGVLDLDPSLVENLSGTSLPLATERTMTLLSSRYLATEAAVQAVLASLVDPELVDDLAARASQLFVPDAEEVLPAGGPQGAAHLVVPGREHLVKAQLDACGLAIASPFLSAGPVVVVDTEADPRPYAAWETVELGPETLAVSRSLSPRSEDTADGLTELSRQATELGYATVLAPVTEDDRRAAASVGFHPVLSSPGLELQVWVHQRDTGGATQWRSPSNPDPAPMTTGWTLRRARLEHVERIVDLDALEYLDPMATAAVAEMVSNYPAVVALAGDRVLGFAVTRPLVGCGDRVGELYTIAVHPELRSQGVGSSMLSAVTTLGELHGWEAMWLESSMVYQNRFKGSPVSMYQRNGWELVAATDRTVYMAKVVGHSGVQVRPHPSAGSFPAALTEGSAGS